MKDLFKILRIVFEYKRQAFISIFFNILFVVFGLFSVAGITPLLNVLFTSSGIITEGQLTNTPGQNIVSSDTVQNTDIVPSFKLDMGYILDVAQYYVGKIVDSKGPQYALLLICAFIVFMSLLKTFSRFMSLYFLAPVRMGIMKTLRNKTFSKILKLPLSYYSEERKGDIIARMTSDVQEVENSIISTFEVVFKDPLIILFTVFALVTLSFKLTVFILILLPLSGMLIGRLGKKLKSGARKGQSKLGFLISILEETISGLRIIKAFNAENKTEGRFFNVNRFYTRIMVGLFRRRGLSSPLSEFLGTFVIAVVVWYGSNLVLKADSSLSPEKLIVFILLFYTIINPAKQVSTAYYSIQKGLASLDRINAILEAPVTIVDKKDAKTISEFKESIEYKNVSFKYDKDLVLKNINLKIEKGKSIALVGQSGSGKSTMVDLIPRFIDAIEGEVLIDGIPVKDYKTKDVRDLMGIVTQESILFNDSVYNNIAYSMDNVDAADVIKAAKVANAHEFIEKMKYDYHTNIGDRGHKLSGGQRQRISIARAVMKNPPILILDEATSALDTESEMLVQDALVALMKNRTSIVIAHRLSTIKNVDEIIVLHEGEIVERGKHEELIKLNGQYKKLVELQNFN